jgi:hypothetical protein
VQLTGNGDDEHDDCVLRFSRATQGDSAEMSSSRQIRFDSSTVSLIVTNLVTIAFAIAQKWDLREIMWVYWSQSVIIGFFNVLRILNLKQFRADGMKINDKPVTATPAAQRLVAGFFALHYGFFHFVYMIFLIARGFPSSGSLPAIGLCIAAFFVNHAFSYWHNREQDELRKPHLGLIMIFPYARIIPMHLTIIIGSAFGETSVLQVIFFLVLKTVADVIMHMIEHSKAWLQPELTSEQDDGGR